jgi:hypothetical protein
MDDLTQFGKILYISFVPLAAIAAKLIFPTLKPPKNSPFVFVLSGTFFLLFGVLVLYAIHVFLESGMVKLSGRWLREIHPTYANQPIEYCVTIVALYLVAVLLSGVGVAGVSLVFSRSRRFTT